MSTTQPLWNTQHVDDALIGIKPRYPDWGMQLAHSVTSHWIQTTKYVPRWDKVGVVPGVDDTRELYLTLHSLEANAEIADPDFDGAVIVDWEGDFDLTFWAGRDANPTTFDLMLADAKALVAFLRMSRPKAFIGWYGLPIFKHIPTVDYYNRHREIITLIDTFDFIHPTIYHLTDREMDHTSRIHQMETSLAIANGIDWPDGEPSGGLTDLPTREVNVAISHRRSPGDDAGPLEETRATFLAYVQPFLDFTYGGFSMNGWKNWHGDRYYITRAWDKSDGTEGPPFVNTGTRWNNIRTVFGADGFSWSSTEADITNYLADRLPNFYNWLLETVSQVNTPTRRASVVSVARPWRPRSVVPDSLIDRYDRALIGWSYAGIDYSAGGDGGSGYFAMSYHGLVTPNISGNM